MVKIEIDLKQEELQALDALYQDAKVPINMGLVLGMFRTKLQQALIDKAKAEKDQAIKAEAKALLDSKKKTKGDYLDEPKE